MNMRRRILHERFAASYDEALAFDLLHKNDEKLDATFERLGTGTHFSTWKLHPTGDKGLRLVLKKAHGKDFSPGSTELREWAKNLKKLKALSSSLLPPFALVTTSTATGLIMPYGEAPLHELGPDWLPFDMHARQLIQDLKAVGLYIDDVLQWRVHAGQPFLIDFSDLKAL